MKREPMVLVLRVVEIDTQLSVVRHTGRRFGRTGPQWWSDLWEVRTSHGGCGENGVSLSPTATHGSSQVCQRRSKRWIGCFGNLCLACLRTMEALRWKHRNTRRPVGLLERPLKVKTHLGPKLNVLKRACAGSEPNGDVDNSQGVRHEQRPTTAACLRNPLHCSTNHSSLHAVRLWPHYLFSPSDVRLQFG